MPDVELIVVEETKWHAIPVAEILKMQSTSPEGLFDSEAEARLKQYGTNELTPPPKPSFLMKVFIQINNILIYILIAAAIVAGVLQDWAEVALIGGVVVINVTIGLVQEGRAEQAAAAIQGMLSSKATVIRSGERKLIDAKNVVPGDVCFIQAGDRCPADLRMIEVTGNCGILEAMLTGESNPISKHTDVCLPQSALGDRKNMAFSATMVMTGQGKGVVCGTGDLAEIGKISAMVSNVDSQKTNLMVQLEMFGRWISVFVLIIAVITFCVAYLVHDFELGDAFKSTVAIAVAIIPEGLPAVVTISLALAMQMLANNNAIIRQLPAVETLGSVTVICSDKTGTLTKNEMTVQLMQTSTQQYKMTGVGYSPVGVVQDENSKDLPDEKVARMLKMFEGAVLCNDAGIFKNLNHKNPNVPVAWEPIGYPTEVALLTMGMKMGITEVKDFKAQQPRVGGVPFASEHKFMCCVHAASTAPGAPLTIHVKGAPDRLIPQCKNQVMDDDLSKVGPIDENYWQDKASQMSGLGLRCLAICRADFDPKDLSDNMDADLLLKAPTPFLTMIGVVAILDPPRPEAIEGVAVAQMAGIVVKMITGDHPATATAIAKMLGIVDPKLQESSIRTYTGPELDAMDDEGMDSIVLECNVFARASPENKIRIVKSLQRRGQTVSMTGDGVNDAPALKAANIGVAMGITGTDVSKEAAKMVLADDNFATIVKAVREGRRVWDNLVKILLYNMPVNFAQGLSVFFAYIVDIDGHQVPLTAIQVLYVNMITSVTMGLMLAMEPAEDDIMQRPPRRKGKRLFGKMVFWHCIFVSGIMVVCVLGNFAYTLNNIEKSAEDYLYEAEKAADKITKDQASGRRAVKVPKTARLMEARAVAFNMLVFAEMAYALNCRFLKDSAFNFKMFTENKWCWVSIAVTTVLQIFLTYTPGVREVFSNAPIGGASWALILACSLAVFVLVEIEKVIGIHYVMPHIKSACAPRGCCTGDGEHERTQSELNQVQFFASGASTFGLPTRAGSANAGERHGAQGPVAGAAGTSGYNV
mmetsp:Transcript_4907/g.10865  ORF Transcript_4907/g.10865 Transcript_4907/m.10865 type:complete len:1039 (+) Transcript_4907:173-3289(+)